MLVGIIGLGIMGKPMAKNLIKGGFSLYVHDVDALAVAELTALGAEACTPAVMAARCDAILTMLPSGAVVKQVLLGTDGVLAHVRRGTLVMDMSSVTPEETQACGAAALTAGADYLDAPVSGGEPKAIDGTLAFMVGGTEAAFAKAKPLFDCMGASAVLVGGVGAGCVAKLANQVIVNLTIAAVSEALTLAVKAGVDPQKVFSAIRGGLAGSAVLEAKAPMMLAHNFRPGGKLSINRKDIGNVLQTAHHVDMPMPLTAQLMEMMTVLKGTGHIEDDHGGIVQYYEALAGVTVRPMEDGGAC